MNNIGLGRGSSVEKRRKLLHQGLKVAVYGIPLLALGLTINSSVLMTDAVIAMYTRIILLVNSMYSRNQVFIFECHFCPKLRNTTKSSPFLLETAKGKIFISALTQCR